MKSSNEFSNFDCMRQFVVWLLIGIPLVVHSQSKQDASLTNPRYFEDQFYAGITYNFILNLPDDASQRNFSYGLQAGFIKDIPLNRDRTVGIGLGLGLALNTYYSNIRALENGDVVSYQLVDNEPDFKRSKVETHALEVPLEFRWRNSNPETYSFWRIYTGLKFEYVLNTRSKYVETNQKRTFSNADVRSLQYGLTFNVGYHNFNIHAYYALTNLFNDGVTLEGNAIDIRTLRIGLIFYIL